MTFSHAHFHGVSVALSTPYLDDLSIDWKTFERQVVFLCEKGVHGLVPCGSTGEFLALTAGEQRDLIACCVRVANDFAHKPWVVAGASTVEVTGTLKLIEQAHACGAQGVLVVSPYYVKPTQSSLKAYYQALAKHGALPLILYNNPRRTGTEIDLQTIIDLMQAFPDKVVALKEASHSLSRVLDLSCGIQEDRGLLSGEDNTFLPFLAAGGHGIISVAAGLVPTFFLSLWNAWKEGNLHRAQKESFALAPLLNALGQGVNPMAIKYALFQSGFGQGQTRLPLDLSAQARSDIDQALTLFDKRSR